MFLVVLPPPGVLLLVTPALYRQAVCTVTVTLTVTPIAIINGTVTVPLVCTFACGGIINNQTYLDLTTISSIKPPLKPIFDQNANPFALGPHAPNANPNQSPNASQWNIVCVGYARVGLALSMSISCCLSCFFSPWVPNANTVSSGIQA